MHWHAMLVRPTPADLLAGDIGHLNLTAGAEATDTLMRGFTTVRDLGGPSFGLKRAIDEGVVPGPRIYPSGAMITVTGGHGDLALRDRPYPAEGTATTSQIVLRASLSATTIQIAANSNVPTPIVAATKPL
jgi:imidazolonepropionase-like amidohydrolase